MGYIQKQKLYLEREPLLDGALPCGDSKTWMECKTPTFLILRMYEGLHLGTGARKSVQVQILPWWSQNCLVVESAYTPVGVTHVHIFQTPCRRTYNTPLTRARSVNLDVSYGVVPIGAEKVHTFS